MFLTPKEANEKKMCPLSISGDGFRPCIADECMAWRWRDKERGWCGLASPPLEAQVVRKFYIGPESQPEQN